MRRWRKVMYPLIGLLILVVFGLSLYQTYVADLRGRPDVLFRRAGLRRAAAAGRQRGAYVQLKPGANPRFPSNLVQLLETDTPGVVTAEQMLTLERGD